MAIRSDDHTGVVPLFRHKTFKEFYIDHVCKLLTKEFPDTVSYNRMVELKSESFMPLAIYLKTYGLSSCTGIGFIDSYTLAYPRQEKDKPTQDL